MQSREFKVNSAGINLAVKTWGNDNDTPILALHGWQDNAATFDRLIPQIPDYYWIVPDLPGHGLSEHRGKGAEYTIWSYCAEIIALADQLGLEKFTLLGHSMGGGISNLLAAVFSERIEKLILLDVIGTITTPANNSLEQLSMGLKHRTRQALRKPGVYSSLDEAINARARKGVTVEAAALLGVRGIAQSEAGFYWQHDQRLTQKNLLSMCDEQLRPFLRAITCPVLLITSTQAVQREDAIKLRVAEIKNIHVENLSGGHHQHLDGDVDTIAGLVRTFLK